METPPKENFLYDAVLPKVELLGWPLAVLGLGLLCAGKPIGLMLLIIGLGSLAQVFFLRAFEPIAAGNTPTGGIPYISITLPPAASFFSLVSPKIQGIAGAITLIGVLFKLLFWQGSATLLLVGMLTLVPVAAWQLATGRLRWRVAVVTMLGLSVWLTPTETLVRQLYRDDPVLVAKMLYQQQHPHDRAAAQEVQRLLRARRQRPR